MESKVGPLKVLENKGFWEHAPQVDFSNLRAQKCHKDVFS